MLLLVFLALELVEARGVFIYFKRMYLINTGWATDDYSKETKMTDDNLALNWQHSNLSIITGLLISHLYSVGCSM